MFPLAVGVGGMDNFRFLLRRLLPEKIKTRPFGLRQLIFSGRYARKNLKLPKAAHPDRKRKQMTLHLVKLR